ncbi:MAG: helix-turn-helix domain-containing protein [Phaeodactylibacter sp.]|nr:helix-turn-helix domain-containing protein [Phaeodactylibacter sp.]
MSFIFFTFYRLLRSPAISPIACFSLEHSTWRPHIFRALTISMGLLLLAPPALSGQANGTGRKYSVEQLTIEQGLSDNKANACLQDRTGYLWFGTNDGLNRYDGYAFTVYKHSPGDSSSISNNKINALLEDEAGLLWIGTDGGLNCFDPRTETFRSYQHDPADEKSISHNQVKTLLIDESGLLWLGTFNGLNRFDKSSQTFSRFWHQATHHLPWEKEPTHIVTALGSSAGGRLLVGYAGMGLMLFDQKAGTFRQVLMEERADKGMGLNIYWIAPPQNGKNWVVATEKLYQYAEDGHLALAGTSSAALAGIGLNGFRRTHSGRYLAPSWQGLYVLDSNFQQTGFFLPEGLAPFTPAHNWALGPIEDQAGDIWFGTGGAGVFHIVNTGNHFINFHYQAGQRNGVPHSYINALLEVGDDEVWIAARRHGLKVFNPKTYSFRPVPPWLNPPNGLNTNEISALFQDSKGNIWIGTWGGGLNLCRPKTKTVEYFLTDRNDSTSLSDDFVTDILETAEHEIWVSTTLGVSVLKDQEAIEKGRFKSYRHSPEKRGALNHHWATCLLQAENGNIWVGTLDGLHRFDPETDAFILYQQGLKAPNSLANNTINAIFEDSRGQLWIGTAGGLEKFNPATHSFEHYLESEGLADGYIIGIQEDKQGFLWLATKNGISRFCPKTGKFKNYDSRDGLLNHGFNPNAFISSKSKAAFYAGGKNGLSLFYPDSIRENPFIPAVVISSLKKYSTRGGKTLETKVKGITHRDEIHLSYEDNIIIFELTALNFRNSKKNQYAYQLYGFNNDWINLGTKREITFTSLDPGQYTLNVQGSNNDDRWNQATTSLTIVVHPPWWATWWAYLLYAVVLGGILYAVRRSELHRQALKTNLALEKVEADKLKELDSFKSRLYTNLTHEFRTPLTVILGMAEQIKKAPHQHLDDGVELIRNNGKNLLQLINQLLDLSKLESGAFQLQLQQGDVVPYLRYLAESFQTYANSRNLSLRFHTSLESLVMDYDPEQLKQVVTNLISNAVKFTPSGGEVTVRAKEEDKQLFLEVSDNGVGIDQEKLPYIFNRFYQADSSTTRRGEGTGIGLAHTQELVKLMGGDIAVESQLGKGTTFTISLPIRHTAEPEGYAGAQMEEAPTPLTTLPAAEETFRRPPSTVHRPLFASLPHLLLIEDNPDVVTYLRSCLSDFYQLDVAYNGLIGIEKAIENIPDLIISDVMMPEKNGYEVCDTLKNDERTSHIPIILLTAKADASSKITGLRRGADAYLAKPFDREELLVRLAKLVERQQRMVAYFSARAPIPEVKKEDVQVEDEFIQKVRRIIEQHYKDEDFGLPQLCQKIRMSRSQLYRKLKALTGASPSDFIRSYRLNKARDLLETSGLNVSEVAWEVGYKDVAHFSRSYQEAFGFPPSATSN